MDKWTWTAHRPRNEPANRLDPDAAASSHALRWDSRKVSDPVSAVIAWHLPASPDPKTRQSTANPKRAGGRVLRQPPDAGGRNRSGSRNSGADERERTRLERKGHP